MAIAPQLPERIHHYHGFLTDSNRWDRFTPRDDDIIISTPAKSGTTWMQAICALLIFQTPELDFNPAERSPWIDVTFEPIDEIIANLEGQQRRRVIKTHTPLDGIPFFPQCTYITVYRDPRDAFFSMRNHMENMKLEIPREIEKKEPDAAFRDWVAADFAPGDEPMALAATVHHLESYWKFRHLPNIHFFHYADLKRDLEGGMREVAAAMGVETDPALLVRLAQAASFENMKSRAEQFVPGIGRDTWHDAGRFLNKGSHGQWREELSEQALREFGARLAEMLPPDRAAWLEHGDSRTAA